MYLRYVLFNMLLLKKKRIFQVWHFTPSYGPCGSADPADPRGHLGSDAITVGHDPCSSWCGCQDGDFTKGIATTIVPPKMLDKIRVNLGKKLLQHLRLIYYIIQCILIIKNY